MTDLSHVTIPTGDVRLLPRGEVGDDAIAVLGPLLEGGEHRVPGMVGYRCTITIDGAALLATVWHGRRPLVMFAVAPDAAAADALWPALERRPEALPWCAAITILATPAEALWVADSERCLAWAWIERRWGPGA